MVQDLKEKGFAGLIVRIDRARCIATTNCIKLAPGQFELDDERVVTFKPDATEQEREALIEACDSCPVDALSVFDESGRQIVPS